MKSFYVQGNPQRMRLQRRLYGVYADCFLIFMTPCYYKLVFIFVQSFNKLLKVNTQGNYAGIVNFFMFYVVFTVSSFVGNPVYLADKE